MSLMFEATMCIGQIATVQKLSQVSPLIGGDTTSYLDTDEYLSARGRYYYVVQAMNYTGLYSPYSLPAGRIARHQYRSRCTPVLLRLPGTSRESTLLATTG